MRGLLGRGFLRKLGSEEIALLGYGRGSLLEEGFYACFVSHSMRCAKILDQGIRDKHHEDREATTIQQ